MADIYGEKKKNGARAQWEKLKGAPLKDKIQYIATYYGVAIVLAGIGIWMLYSLIHGIIYNSVPNVVAGEFYSYSVSSDGAEQLRLDLCDKLGLEEKKYHIDISGSAIDTDNTEQYYYQLQKIMARLSTNDVDFMAGPESLLSNYMDMDDNDSCAYLNLKDVLPTELYDKLEADGRILSFTMSDGTVVPYAIDVSATYITQTLEIPDEVENYMACCVNTENQEGFVALIELIYEK